MRCFKVAAEKVSASVERIHGPLYCVAEATPLDKSAGELNSSGKRLGDLREVCRRLVRRLAPSAYPPVRVGTPISGG